MRKLLVIEIFGHCWKSDINIISTIISVWTSFTQSKTILCFTRRMEENVQANNRKNGRKNKDRIRYWKKMELSIEWEKSHNTIGETKTKMSLQKTRKG